MSQSQFDDQFAEGAAKLFKEYLDTQIKTEAAEEKAVMDEARELGVLPMVVPVGGHSTTEEAADESVPQIEKSALRKIHVAVRLLSEVLKPQVFKADWRVKFEKKAGATTKLSQKFKDGSVKRTRDHHIILKDTGGGSSMDARFKEEKPDWKIGNFNKRAKNAAMTDYAM